MAQIMLRNRQSASRRVRVTRAVRSGVENVAGTIFVAGNMYTFTTVSSVRYELDMNMG